MIEAKRRKPEKAKRILDAAFSVMVARGYSGSSMDEVARAAGVSKPTLYAYFGGKEALFTALLHHQKDLLLRPLDLAPGQSMVRTMVEFSAHYARFALDPRTLAFGRMVIGEAARFPGIGKLYEESGPLQALRGIAAFMKDMRSQGRLKFADAELAADDFWSLILSTPRGRAMLRPELRARQLRPGRHIANGLAVFIRAYSARPDDDLRDLEIELARRDKRAGTARGTRHGDA